MNFTCIFCHETVEQSAAAAHHPFYSLVASCPDCKGKPLAFPDDEYLAEVPVDRRLFVDRLSGTSLYRRLMALAGTEVFKMCMQNKSLTLVLFSVMSVAGITENVCAVDAAACRWPRYRSRVCGAQKVHNTTAKRSHCTEWLFCLVCAALRIAGSMSNWLFTPPSMEHASCLGGPPPVEVLWRQSSTESDTFIRDDVWLTRPLHRRCPSGWRACWRQTSTGRRSRAWASTGPCWQTRSSARPTS